jgi:hypothetical protein
MSWRVNQLGESGNSLFAPLGLAVCECVLCVRGNVSRTYAGEINLTTHTHRSEPLSHSLLFYNGESAQAQQQKTLFGDRLYSRFNESGEALWFVTRREWLTAADLAALGRNQHKYRMRSAKNETRVANHQPRYVKGPMALMLMGDSTLVIANLCLLINKGVNKKIGQSHQIEKKSSLKLRFY